MSMVCRMLGHRRSAKHAKFDFESQRWESVCVQCRAPMIRIAEGEWRLANEVRDPQDTELF